MSLAVIMKDVMVTEEVDEDFKGALDVLNDGAKDGKNFVVMDGADGNRVLLNMSNILMIKEQPD